MKLYPVDVCLFSALYWEALCLFLLNTFLSFQQILLMNCLEKRIYKYAMHYFFFLLMHIMIKLHVNVTCMAEGKSLKLGKVKRKH